MTAAQRARALALRRGLGWRVGCWNGRRAYFALGATGRVLVAAHDPAVVLRVLRGL